MARRTTPPRRPLECVLVAADLSSAAARAVERAARLPIRRSGRLHLAAARPVLVVRRPAARPYRCPLLATDLEDTSFRLTEAAQRVLGPGGATVELVHAYHMPFAGFVPPSTDGQPTSYHRNCRDKAAADLAAFARTLTRGAWRWKPVVRQGDARLVILDEVARRRPDVLVLGTHGRTGAAHALLGSVAESAIGAAPCDVLVARPARFSFQLP
jgi:nucleotide-binding universal stress UspA family protein